MAKSAKKIQPNHTILLKKPSLLIQSGNTILISGLQGFASKDIDTSNYKLNTLNIFKYIYTL